ncbi:helix-turn-helix transcriptional regulator [Paenibacillus lutimineralis]|uniref:helix-turn-helix transcriptional regulator n=1 Tax=Paenibacillus lutimineralis TaxID=2707005 RepID=UPI0026D2AF7E
MDKYHISKSTALRDISSLDQLGMPIYSEHGRHGRYGILQNRLLSPIIFTMDEVYALYFAMLTLEAYQSTPFHLCESTK